MQWNTANKLTMLRVILIPVYLVLWYLDMETSAYWALGVFVLASVTDFLDGYVARHYNQVTTFGKFMDPLADKILVITAMIWFVSTGLLPVWALVIVVAREFAVSGLRLIAVDNGRVIAAAWSGKVKTFSTMVCLCLMHLPIPEVLVQVCVWVIVLTTVYSGIEYFWKNKDVMK
ncbi:CDP-diacylglycerol--glycerol-3-phosphate 3-phosphatidyltransferase [Pseudoflavonifractor capillosus]|uniref:CDP-diacylglycerol--glycerol-3-phosphate 3-phosphatidyltransferase n=1 Tax=Pseudoflavonifractor capillosus TaxID=106588 RepID=UPI00195CEDB5|nr:CDP-diacylglycerol--glycerol-3-phosphate 3-phosphatidyltransferase [Pseudoflavonifractor capillosus]MBM6896730.1 CDP-diacylglycerol--glycerol-3-phosphate 3-phosphatidyltransferase [Pseudoflavonifractor capillosus]